MLAAIGVLVDGRSSWRSGLPGTSRTRGKGNAVSLEFTVWPVELVDRFASKARAMAEGASSITADQCRALERLAAATELAGATEPGISAFVRHALSEAGLGISDNGPDRAALDRTPAIIDRPPAAWRPSNETGSSRRGGVLLRVSLKSGDSDILHPDAVRVVGRLALLADGTLWDCRARRSVGVPGEVQQIAYEYRSPVILTNTGVHILGGAYSSESTRLDGAPPPGSITDLAVDDRALFSPTKRWALIVGIATNDGRLMIWQRRTLTWKRGSRLSFGVSPDVEAQGPVLRRLCLDGYQGATLLTEDGELLAQTRASLPSRFRGAVTDIVPRSGGSMPRIADITRVGLALDEDHRVWRRASRYTEYRPVAPLGDVALIRDDLAATWSGDIFRLGRYGESTPVALVQGARGIVDLASDGEDLLVVTTEPDALLAGLTAER